MKRSKNILWGIIFSIAIGCSLSCFAEFKSTTNSMTFDLNFDNNFEMLLSGNGLFIGSPVREPSANLQVLGNAIVTQQLSVGGSGASSNLTIYGTQAVNYQILSSNTTLSNYSTVFINSSSSNITITLPYAGNVAGRIYSIKKSSAANDVWIIGDNCSIDDLSSIEWLSGNTLPSVGLISNGQQWMIMTAYTTIKTVASDNLIGWWKMDETSGNTLKDSSSGGRHGTFSGNLSSNTISGVVLNAVSFNNSNSVNLGNTLDIDDISFSLCAWAKRGSVGGEDYIFGQGPNMSNPPNYQGLHVGFRPDSTFRTSFYGNDLTSDATYLETDWNFLVFTYDYNTKLRSIFRNGIFVKANTSGDKLNSSGNTFYIGSNWDNTRPFHGQLDDVRIYNKVLTPAEIMGLYGDYK